MMTQNIHFNVLRTWMVARKTGVGQVRSASNHLDGYWEGSMKMVVVKANFTCFEIWTQSWFPILQRPADS
jgi:hypothetical protein